MVELAIICRGQEDLSTSLPRPRKAWASLYHGRVSSAKNGCVREACPESWALLAQTFDSPGLGIFLAASDAPPEVITSLINMFVLLRILKASRPPLAACSSHTSRKVIPTLIPFCPPPPW